MLEVIALKKSYCDQIAVDGISLRAAAGETVGLLGPNGAGKTTTVSIIAGLLRPDSGQVLIEGRAFGRRHRPGQAQDRTGSPGHRSV